MMLDSVNRHSDNKRIYDLTLVNQMCRGRQDLVLKLMQVFIQQVAKSMEELSLAFQENDFEKIRQEMHKVKPTLSYYGTFEIQHELRTFEHLIHGDYTVEEVQASIDRLAAVTAATLDQMKRDFRISK